MSNFDTDTTTYDPHDHRTDLAAVFASFIVLAAVLAALFLA